MSEHMNRILDKAFSRYMNLFSKGYKFIMFVSKWFTKYINVSYYNPAAVYLLVYMWHRAVHPALWVDHIMK